MRLTKLPVWILALGWCSAPPASAALSAELADLAARIDYGFYNDDARSIEAARTALARLGDSPSVIYYRDLAALRLAQLTPVERSRAALVSDCAGRVVASDAKGRVAAEAWILVAACAQVARSNRRVEQALAAARVVDRGHPRIALVEAWVLQNKLADDAGLAAAVAQKWQDAVAGFDRWNASPDALQWGHAEALAALGEIALLRGETRKARDLVERALLLAPDYRFAVELRSRLQGGAAARTP